MNKKEKKIRKFAEKKGRRRDAVSSCNSEKVRSGCNQEKKVDICMRELGKAKKTFIEECIESEPESGCFVGDLDKDGNATNKE